MTQEKWDKARGYARELVDAFLNTPKGQLPTFDHKDLERKRGFFIHLAITFGSIVPFLKGIHLTLDSWRPGRGSDGWKMRDKEWRVYMASISKEGEIPEVVLNSWSKGAPKRVKAAARLEEDLKAISSKGGSHETQMWLMVRTLCGMEPQYVTCRNSMPH